MIPPQIRFSHSYYKFAGAKPPFKAVLHRLRHDLLRRRIPSPEDGLDSPPAHVRRQETIHDNQKFQSREMEILQIP